MKNIIFAVAILVLPSFVYANDLVDKLQTTSVTIQTDRGSGSGVLRTRKVGNDNVTYVITAAHVVNSLRHVKDGIDVRTGAQKKILEYDDCYVVQTIVEDGRTVARYNLSAKLVKMSEEEDLAVLQIRKKNFTTASAKIYLDKKIPSLGDEVWNVGSALGIEGAGTASKGICSQVGRLLNGHIYDQFSCPGFPGCSGSGIFLNDGRMIAVLTNGAGETYILGVPSRRLVDWAKKSKLEWVVNDDIEMPTQSEIDKIPVEDISTVSHGDNGHSKKVTTKTLFLNRLVNCYPF